MLLIGAACAEFRFDVFFFNISLDDQVLSFKSSLTLYLLNPFQWFVCCCPVQVLVQSGLKCSEVCFRAIYRQC